MTPDVGTTNADKTPTFMALNDVSPAAWMLTEKAMRDHDTKSVLLFFIIGAL